MTEKGAEEQVLAMERLLLVSAYHYTYHCTQKYEYSHQYRNQ